MEFETAIVKLGASEQEIHRLVVPAGADFAEQAVIEEARRITGLDDFGGDAFFPNLRALIASMEGDAALNDYGRVFARQTLVGRLIDRLRAQALFDQHPEILEREIGPQLFVVGPARSGTTRVHRMIAADPRFAFLRDWEVNFPVPNEKAFAARAADEPDPRIDRARRAHALFGRMNPVNLAIHGLDAEAPEEEIGLLNLSFCGLMLEAQRFIPTYGWSCFEADQTHAYEYMKQMIQLVSWFRDDDERRPWVFKSPQHMQDLDALMAVFPDAKIVFTHRDMGKVVPSNCSMNWNLTILGSDHTDPEAMGEYLHRKILAQIEKVERERASIVPPDQQIDVRYTDLGRDWQAEFRRIYDFMGMPFDATAIAAIEAWTAGDQTHSAGGHRYRPHDFGLDPAELAETFADYHARHGVETEG